MMLAQPRYCNLNQGTMDKKVDRTFAEKFLTRVNDWNMACIFYSMFYIDGYLVN